MNNSEEKNPIKIGVKISAIILIVCFVLPVFTVSCAGKSEGVSAIESMAGYEMENFGETSKISDPQPALIILLLLPIVMLIVGGFTRRPSLGEVICNSILAFVEMIGYIIFKSGVKEFAGKNGCSFKVTGFFVIVIILCLGCIIGNVLMLVIRMPKKQTVSYNYNINYNYDQPYQSPPASPGGWVCSCGNVLRDEDMFCGRCGSSKPQ